jgi:hypothetical protein
MAYALSCPMYKAIVDAQSTCYECKYMNDYGRCVYISEKRKAESDKLEDFTMMP